ncbi:zinc finger protein 2 homolog isoform X2 [Ixodes scapularis]
MQISFTIQFHVSSQRYEKIITSNQQIDQKALHSTTLVLRTTSAVAPPVAPNLSAAPPIILRLGAGVPLCGGAKSFGGAAETVPTVLPYEEVVHRRLCTELWCTAHTSCTSTPVLAMSSVTTATTVPGKQTRTSGVDGAIATGVKKTAAQRQRKRRSRKKQQEASEEVKKQRYEYLKAYRQGMTDEMKQRRAEKAKAYRQRMTDEMKKRRAENCKAYRERRKSRQKLQAKPEVPRQAGDGGACSKTEILFKCCFCTHATKDQRELLGHLVVHGEVRVSEFPNKENFSRGCRNRCYKHDVRAFSVLPSTRGHAVQAPFRATCSRL